MISWHRFYDPETGRYISADPIGLEGGMNLYAYVGGNPINAIDPKGLKTGKDVKDLFDKFKSIVDVYNKCNGLFDQSGQLDCKCEDLGKCLECTKEICKQYGPVGTPSFGACYYPLKKACSVCLN